MAERVVEVVMNWLPMFARDRRLQMRWSREHMRESGVIRELCHWYHLKYGAPLTFVDLTVELLSRYRQYRRQFDTPTAFNRRRTTLRLFCDWAMSQGLLHRNPMRRIPVMKRPRKRKP